MWQSQAFAGALSSAPRAEFGRYSVTKCLMLHSLRRTIVQQSASVECAPGERLLDRYRMGPQSARPHQAENPRDRPKLQALRRQSRRISIGYRAGRVWIDELAPEHGEFRLGDFKVQSGETFATRGSSGKRTARSRPNATMSCCIPAATAPSMRTWSG
jgi:hypothetical protein